MLEQWIKENANMKDRGSVAVINDDVWILPPRCFSNMPGLKKVILPYNLRKIGAFSFAGCRSLEVIDIPRQVVLIDYGAFYGCCSLKAINLPDRVVGIGSMAFAGTNLSTITLPKDYHQCSEIPYTSAAETAADFFMKILYESQNISMCPFFSQIDQIRFRKCFSDNSAVEEKIIKNIIEMTETV